MPRNAAQRLDEASPVFQGFWCASVNLEPDQCFLKRSTMHQGPFRARRRFEVHQSALHGQQLTQAIGIPTRDRQHADAHRRVFR